jgi:hypothetical protein
MVSRHPDRAKAIRMLPHPTSHEPQRRRGATALEYLFVVSLILIVAISAIQYFGEMTAGTTNTASDAIEKATSSM